MSGASIGIDELRDRLQLAMGSDRFRLNARLRRLTARARTGHDVSHQLDQLARQIERSRQLREERLQSVPLLRFQDDLPIEQHRAAIREAIQNHPVVIVSGQTGSGKSTQLPKICLEAGRGIDGWIGHTQPRRLAARNIAHRLADELDVTMGQQVGYQVRFTDTTRPTTLIKVMTDGILLAETERDRFLDRYDTIILDEAHERSLNIDFLLGYLHRLLARRPQLRLLITSATLDAARFQAHFSSLGPPVPLIEIPGRGYPVEVRYRPPDPGDSSTDPDLPRAIQEGVSELLASGPGDMLIFLPTEGDIRQVAQSLRGWSVAERRANELEILPLYARLSPAEQQRIYQTSSRRRVILATNVAESSLTVPGIRYVIDSGTARLSRFSPRAKVQQLPIEPISQASAQQRAGRCGRLGPGICIRLYDEEDFQSRPPHTTPEIRRTNLAAVILKTKALELGNIEQFPLLDPPRPDALREGYQTLFELGAIDERQELTDLGRVLSRLPIDPRLGRMIVAGQQENCLREILIIAAALEVQDPRDRPADRRSEVEAVQREFTDESSDFMSYLRLWDFVQKLREDHSRRQWMQLCRHFHLSTSRLREWSEMVRQLRGLVEQQGWRLQSRRDDHGAIHRSLLTGLLSGVAYRRGKFEYRGVQGTPLFLWPGSSLFGRRPAWIMSAEILETTKRYARSVAEIDPAWIEPLAEHLVTRRHVNPTWSRRRGQARCQEKVSLFGMPIVTGRSIPYAKVDRSAAREMFIRRGLVEGNMAGSFRFIDHNRRVVLEALELAGKLRRSDWYRGEEAQYRFYDEALPEKIVDLSRLRQWLPAAERRNPSLLRMRLDDLVADPREDLPTTDFPPTLELDAVTLPLQYRHQPGNSGDGITATIPRVMLGHVKAEPFEWLVPGRLEEKVAALIRLLPKPIRRCLVPAPDTAKAVVADLPFGEGPFLKRLARQLQRRAEMPIEPEDLPIQQLPPHLRMNFRIVDEQGEVLAEGRDLSELRRNLSNLQGEAKGQSDRFSQWEQPQLTRWTFGDLPESVEMHWGGVQIRKYPTLLDQKTHVDLTLRDWQPDAESRLRQGVRRLFVLTEKRELRAQLAWLPRMEEIREQARDLPDGDRIDDEVMDLLADRAFLPGPELPRSQAAFEQQCEFGRARIPLAVQELAHLLPTMLQAYSEAQAQWERHQSPAWKHATNDVARQLEALVHPGYLTATPLKWLQHFPRYLKGISYRLERLTSGALDRDRQAAEHLESYQALYREVADEHDELEILDPELTVFRWMLEEYRISLFAQPLGTQMPVSPQRLDKQFARIRR